MTNWPAIQGNAFGDIAGLTVDLEGNVVVFHRGHHSWNAKLVDAEFSCKF